MRRVTVWGVAFVAVAVALTACGGDSKNNGSGGLGSGYLPHTVGDTWKYTRITNAADYKTYTIASSLGNNQYNVNIVSSDGTSDVYLIQIGTETIDILSYTYKNAAGATTSVKTCSPPFPWKLVNPAINDIYSRTYTCTTSDLVSNTTSTYTETKTINIISYETVTTAAGNFTNALKTSYAYNGSTTPGYVWEAEGIGKVKELFSYSTPSNPDGYVLTTYTIH